MEASENVGTRLRKMRERHELSQRQVAEALGIRQSSYHKMEAGTTSLKMKYVTMLAALYGVDPQEVCADLLES